MYLTVVAMASLLVMAFNLNSNMNSNMNAYASIFSDIRNADDIGQSLECVIVVVGCDGTGSVGSSGDVNVGSNNGNNDTNGNGETPIDPDTPVTPDVPSTVCEQCIDDALTDDQISALIIALDVTVSTGDTDLAALCAFLDAGVVLSVLVTALNDVGLGATAIVALLACLGIDVSLATVLAIIGGITA